MSIFPTQEQQIENIKIEADFHKVSVDALSIVNSKLKAENEALRADHEVMKKALEFYADGEGDVLDFCPSCGHEIKVEEKVS